MIIIQIIHNNFDYDFQSWLHWEPEEQDPDGAADSHHPPLPWNCQAPSGSHYDDDEDENYDEYDEYDDDDDDDDNFVCTGPGPVKDIGHEFHEIHRRPREGDHQDWPHQLHRVSRDGDQDEDDDYGNEDGYDQYHDHDHQGPTSTRYLNRTRVFLHYSNPTRKFLKIE